jgi:multicomponent Na+:H+ antiporter subunit D
LEQLPILIPVPLLLFAFIVLLAGIWRKNLVYPLSLIGLAISLITACIGLARVLQFGEMHYYLGGWPPPVGIEYVLDHFSAMMAVLITLFGFIGGIYSRRSILQEVPDKVIPLYPLMLLLLAGLSGIVLTGDLFNLYVFLEIASLSAYALMAVGDKRAPMAVFRYVVMGTIGASFYLLGVGFLYFSTGSLNMADISQILPGLYDSRAIAAGAILIVVGLALKMAIFPLHFWLPDVYTYAPSGVTALIAPIMTKVAAYALIRMILSVFTPVYLADWLPVTLILGWAGAAGIIVASVMAVAQKDLRRMLAYSSVAQICYVALGIGLANPMGLIGALLHILNHAFMKGCLFQVAGAIRYRTGILEINRFAGLGRKMPFTMGAFTVAALSMIGIPPACGFFSKWYLVLGCVDASNWIFIVVIVASSLLNAVYFFRVLERVYMAAPESNESAAIKSIEAPRDMLFTILVLAAGVIVLGFINAVVVNNVLKPIVM